MSKPTTAARRWARRGRSTLPDTAAGRSLRDYPLIGHMDKDALGMHIQDIEAQAAKPYRDALERLVAAWDMRGAGSMQALLDALDEARALLRREVGG